MSNISESFINLANHIKKIKQEPILICLFILATGLISGKLIGILFAVTLIILSFWLPELSLVLIFYSGYLKNLEILQNSPIDLSVLGVLLLIITATIKIAKRNKLTNLRYLDILVILQGILVLFSVVFISSGTWLNWWDGSRFIIFNLSLYFGLFLLSVKRSEISNIIQWILFGLFVIASSALRNMLFGKFAIWHLSSFGESYTILGLVISLGITYLFLKIFNFNHSTSKKIIIFLLYGLLFFILAGVTSRHVSLSLSITLFIAILSKNLLRHRSRLIGVLIFSLLVYLMGLYVANIQGINIKRFWSYEGAYAKSYTVRVEYLKSALQLFKENALFGIGMGEFMKLHGGEGNYPHNLLVESLVSFGILAPFIFWSIFFISFKNSITIMKSENTNATEVVGLWFILLFIDSNFSGSLSNSRMLWLFMGMLSILHNSKNLTNIHNLKTYLLR